MSLDDPHKVGLVTASAGTGKTYDLTSRIKEAIGAGCDPERILASTFTVKAAEELRERARGRLIANGDAGNAVRLLGARIGTINGVCGGLVKEFAFGLDLSPIVDVIDESAAKIAFLKAADEAIGNHADELGPLARIFGYDDAFPAKDWRDDVIKVVELARANNISEDALTACAERSVTGFASLMPAPQSGETAESIEATLLAAIDAVLAHYTSTEGLAKKTIDGIADIRDFAQRARVEELPWQRWARLTKLDVAVTDKPRFAPVQGAAAGFARHPRLFDQVRRYIAGVFACASKAMKAYEEHKRSWGLVDFGDQDRLALELLTKDFLEPQLKERIEAAFVDEFQDTSPLQLAIFVAMSRIAGSSIWVGDPKQAIYGFRGTDPDLITHVAQDIRKATDGEDATLEKSYRSRPGLVAFVNDAFAPTFAAMGLHEGATRIKEVDRPDLPGQGAPLAMWHVDGRNVDQRMSAIAGGVVDALAKGNDWIVAEKRNPRPLAAGDIAVLCRGNKTCLKIADALAAAGLKVAIEREGLFETPEGRLAMCALRWCADRRDTVALAELAHLLDDGEEQPAWFEASLGDDRIEALSALVPIAANLRSIAENGVHKTPLEFLDAVLTYGGVSKAIMKWGKIEDRLLNLEELRKLVATYESERHQSRSPTTVTDLCVWLAGRKATRPPSRASDAVTVMTYHKSKGLEWPLVILTDLNDEPKDRTFDAFAMSDVPGNEIDWRDPLAGRWLRFWPWPLGAQKDNVVLDVAAANTAAGKEAARTEREERARLLYVGATRARDYLVLALPKSKSGWAWLDELEADAGGPVFKSPKAGDSVVEVNGKPHSVRVAELAPSRTLASVTSSIAYEGPVVEPKAFPPLALKPSDETAVENAKIVEEINLGARLPFAGSLDMTSVGDALHRFLAADDPTWDQERRVALAKCLLDAWGVTGLDPRDVVTMGSRFRALIDKRWPGAILRREAPITYRIGHRTLSGRVDVFLETPDVIVVFDHKSFPGARTQWINQARKHAGQLRLYGDAIVAALQVPKRVLLALHLPISGEVLVVE
jgi:ATP-dependent exoDNAse (exonuclease V) beta subunit